MRKKEVLQPLIRRDTLRLPELTAEDIDNIEEKIPRHPLECFASDDGVVITGFGDTGIRSEDGVRYLYVGFVGCQVTEVKEYLRVLGEVGINRKTLFDVLPQGAIVWDIMPRDAAPRLDLP
ncbi:hypothetical protein A2Z00_01965 [Candidatus Gottesmanbacteria bacterium RBG_13_45_10]|uniref:Uncharacterized protein n=1 Tax=Candidatus Gottesmanbacteria bacterium RBG_13_45_10 TaxID=1798370 RepID=A0A1F5ZH90_9BACT|nr:MAG: hypothetical protein A2Z00_01965 [Candidatus Gottesmanbacteria bacterium RBG_13_45_10]